MKMIPRLPKAMENMTRVTMVMALVPTVMMTIMSDPGTVAGAGAGVCHYSAIMATMMGNLSHDWPRSSQPPPNAPKRELL